MGSSINQVDRKILKVAEHVPEGSPFFPLYVEKPSLDQLLHVGGIGEVEPVDFSEALGAFLSITEWSHDFLRKHAGVGGSTYISHVKNRSGPTKEIVLPDGTKQEARVYGNTRYPPVVPRILFGMGEEADNFEIMDWNTTIGRKKIEDRGGRIAVAFYDSNTGDLILKQGKAL